MTEQSPNSSEIGHELEAHIPTEWKAARQRYLDTILVLMDMLDLDEIVQIEDNKVQMLQALKAQYEQQHIPIPYLYHVLSGSGVSNEDEIKAFDYPNGELKEYIDLIEERVRKTSEA